jgi:hypothetical protein
MDATGEDGGVKKVERLLPRQAVRHAAGDAVGD